MIGDKYKMLSLALIGLIATFGLGGLFTNELTPRALAAKVVLAGYSICDGCIGKNTETINDNGHRTVGLHVLQRLGNTVTISKNVTNSSTVYCQPGEAILSAGYYPVGDSNVDAYSITSYVSNNETIIARTDGPALNLTAYAECLSATQ